MGVQKMFDKEGGMRHPIVTVHIGTKVGSEEVIDDTEGKPIDMIHKNVTQVDYTTFPKQKFLLTQM